MQFASRTGKTGKQILVNGKLMRGFLNGHIRSNMSIENVLEIQAKDDEPYS